MLMLRQPCRAPASRPGTASRRTPIRESTMLADSALAWLRGNPMGEAMSRWLNSVPSSRSGVETDIDISLAPHYNHCASACGNNTQMDHLEPRRVLTLQSQ